MTVMAFIDEIPKEIANVPDRLTCSSTHNRKSRIFSMHIDYITALLYYVIFMTL